MAVGLVSRQLAERSVYLELILIFLGGVLGTGHHLYWAGEPGMWVPLGTMFSFIEVLPLVLLIFEAIQQSPTDQGGGEFKYGLAYTYIIGAAFWNFVGAGVFGGGTLNAPLVNYYEHGTFLTLNHAHTALFGAFGLLGIGLIYFCLRYVAADGYPFGERFGRWAFWLYNGGLVLWILFNFFPIGWPQLDAVYEHGLAYARSGAFYDTTLFWQWMRLPGDVVFAARRFTDGLGLHSEASPAYAALGRPTYSGLAYPFSHRSLANKLLRSAFSNASSRTMRLLSTCFLDIGLSRGVHQWLGMLTGGEIARYWGCPATLW